MYEIHVHVLREVDSDGIDGVRCRGFFIHTLRITWTRLPSFLLAHMALEFCKPASMCDITNGSRRVPTVKVSLTAKSMQHGSEAVECSENVFTIYSTLGGHMAAQYQY